MSEATALKIAPARSTATGVFIPIAVAMERSGRSEGHLARACRERWQADGLAELRQPPDGGKNSWWIHESADPSLAPIKFPEQLAFDSRSLTDWQRRELVQRKLDLDQWSAARAHGVKVGLAEEVVTGRFLEARAAAGRQLSRTVLFKWQAGFRAAGIQGLVDGRWIKDSAQPPDSPFVDELKRIYLSQRAPTKSFSYTHAVFLAEQNGWTIPSYRTACAILARIPPRSADLLRRGERKYAGNFGAYIERDYAGLASNQVWESDHHQLDFWASAVDGKLVRPWLTSWMDIASRMIVGHFIGEAAGDSRTILKSFHQAALAHGIPETAHVDNGKDYDAFAIQGMTKRQRQQRRRELERVAAGTFPTLGIKTEHALPYNAKAKIVEPWHRTIRLRFSPIYETFCGSNPQQKPQELSIKMASAPSIAQAREDFGNWLEADYHHRGHGGLEGRTPADVYNEKLGTIRALPKEILDIACMRQSRTLTVGRNGVAFDGITYGQFNEAVTGSRGKKVFVRVNDEDLGQAQVYLPDGKLLCVAQANEKLPFQAKDRAMVKEAMADQRRDRKKARDYFEQRPRLHRSLPDRLAVKAAAIAAAGNRAGSPGDDDPPPSLRPVQTGLEGQLPAILKAIGHANIAVGAEALKTDELALPSRFTYRGQERTEADDVDLPERF